MINVLLHNTQTQRDLLPRLCPSLSQMYFIINQLVAHLPACCWVFFSLSIKHLLLLVWNVTLSVLCRLSLGADLEGLVWTITLQLSPWAVIKHMPSAKCHALVTLLQNTQKTLQDKDKNGPR